MNAIGTGVVLAACVAFAALIVGRIPEEVSRRRAQRRLAAAAGAGLPEPIVGRLGGDTASALASSRRIPRLVVDRALGSPIVTRWGGIGSRRRRRADRLVPPLLESVARELRSGVSLSGALLIAASGSGLDARTADPAVGVLAVSLARGLSVGDAVTSWVGDDPTPSRHLAGTALIVAAHTGGSTAVVIDGVADTLRDRVALEREVAALSSQARASAVLLVVAPVVVAVVAASADARIAGFLLGSPVGWACMVLGVLLDAVGAAWIHLTIRSSQ